MKSVISDAARGGGGAARRLPPAVEDVLGVWRRDDGSGLLLAPVDACERGEVMVIWEVDGGIRGVGSSFVGSDIRSEGGTMSRVFGTPVVGVERRSSLMERKERGVETGDIVGGVGGYE